MGACSVHDCAGAVVGHGLCRRHYERQRRGKPLDWKPRGAAWRRACALWKAAKGRAAAKGVPFSITKEWVFERVSRGACEATGLPIHQSIGGRSPWSASIDRMIPAYGYTPENTRIVCWMFNAAKSEFTDADVLRMARAIVGPSTGPNVPNVSPSNGRQVSPLLRLLG